jgi:hypothetical protein
VVVGKLGVLEASLHKSHLPRAFQVLLGERHEVLPGLERRYVKPSSDKTTCQLAATASDLEHPVTVPDPGDPTGTVDKLVGIRRAVAVIFCRHLIKYLAVAPCGGAVHARDPTLLVDA